MYLRTHNGQALGKARLLGIAHETYVNTCADYDTNNITKYGYSLIQHGDEFALDVGDGESLPEVFWNSLETELPQGWIQQEQEG